MGKKHSRKRREIAHLLFLQCFQKICAADMLKPGFVWERVKCPLLQTQAIHLYLSVGTPVYCIEKETF